MHTDIARLRYVSVYIQCYFQSLSSIQILIHKHLGYNFSDFLEFSCFHDYLR